jgi:hypothetical protein
LCKCSCRSVCSCKHEHGRRGWTRVKAFLEKLSDSGLLSLSSCHDIAYGS